MITIYYFDFLSVGIDIGSKISWARILRPDHKPIGKPIKIDHSSIESLEFLISAIKKAEEQNDLKSRIFVESTGIYHIPLYYYLQGSGFEVQILNPLITDSNKNQGIRKVKSDKSDALRIAKTAYTHALKTSLVPSDTVLNIREYMREYHKLADMKTMHVNKLLKALAVVFPAYRGVFSQITTKTSIAVLESYRKPQVIIETPREELISFIKKTGKRGLEAATKTYDKLINAAKLALVFSHQLEAYYDAIEMEVALIKTFDEHKKRQLEKIEGYMTAHEDETFVQQISLIQTIPGIAFISAVSIMTEMGDFSAFDKPKQLVAYFGLDPTVKESGNFKATQTRLSKRGSRIARRVLFRVALSAITVNKADKANNPVLKEYYDNMIIRKSKKVALGAIMRKITIIVFAVLRDDKPFKLITANEHCKSYKPDLNLSHSYLKLNQLLMPIVRIINWLNGRA